MYEILESLLILISIPVGLALLMVLFIFSVHWIEDWMWARESYKKNPLKKPRFNTYKWLRIILIGAIAYLLFPVFKKVNSLFEMLICVLIMIIIVKLVYDFLISDVEKLEKLEKRLEKKANKISLKKIRGKQKKTDKYRISEKQIIKYSKIIFYSIKKIYKFKNKKFNNDTEDYLINNNLDGLKYDIRIEIIDNKAYDIVKIFYQDQVVFSQNINTYEQSYSEESTPEKLVRTDEGFDVVPSSSGSGTYDITREYIEVYKPGEWIKRLVKCSKAMKKVVHSKKIASLKQNIEEHQSVIRKG